MTQNLGSTSNPLSMTGEQWVLEERTDDPLSPDPGECWIRTDLNAGDKIATLKFGDGSEVPIFPTGTSEPGVLEVRRVQTGGQTGYLPVAEPDESRFPQFRLQHNNTVYSLHDDIEPAVMPDSGDAQYLFDEGSGTTFADNIGTADGSLTGASWHEDSNAVGEWMTEYDGTDDYGEVPTTNQPTIEDEGTVVTTVEIVDLQGGSDTSGVYIFAHPDTSNDNRVYLSINDEQFLAAGLGGDFSVDGQIFEPTILTKYRFGVSWSNGSWEAFVNGTQESSGNYSGSIVMNSESWYWGSLDGTQQFANIRQDNTVIEGRQWSTSDWSDDYSAQPWS